MVTRERFCALIAPFLTEYDVSLYDVEMSGRTFRVLVDRADGVDVDTLGDLSTAISTALDREAIDLPDQMLLEVSSPGLERKLRTPDHFRAQEQETIRLKLLQARAGVRRFEGTLTQVSDDAIQVDVDGVTQEFRYEEIGEARRVFDFDQAFRKADAAAKSETTTEADHNANPADEEAESYSSVEAPVPDALMGDESNPKKAGIS